MTAVFLKNILISNFLLMLTSPKALYNQLEESFAMLRTTVRHWFSHVLSIMANMSNHSISKVNMAALKKIYKYRRICVEIFLSIRSEIILNLFYERIILLFCLEVAVSIHVSNLANWAFFQNIF